MSRESFISPILVAVLALVIAVGGVGLGLAWKTEYLDKWLPPNIKEMFGRGEKPGEKPEEKPKEDLTKDWKTFENKSFGISFKYPKTYQITKEEGIEAGKLNGELELSDQTRPGSPWMFFIFNSAGHGGSCMNDIDYETAIKNGKVVILSREFSDRTKREVCQGLEINDWKIYFHIGGVCKHISGVEGNEIAVLFSFQRTGPDYEPELKEIIKSVGITKEELYCK